MNMHCISFFAEYNMLDLLVVVVVCYKVHRIEVMNLCILTGGEASRPQRQGIFEIDTGQGQAQPLRRQLVLPVPIGIGRPGLSPSLSVVIVHRHLFQSFFSELFGSHHNKLESAGCCFCSVWTCCIYGVGEFCYF